jgi:hypothetical protein
MQIEIDRACYLDSRLDQPGAGFAETVDLLTGLVRRLADEVSLLASAQPPPDWAEAAE